MSSPDGCRDLSRAILGMAAGAPLRDAEVADAVGEIVHMLGGTVARRISGADLVLGLPLFLHGHIEPSDRLTVIALPTRFGAIDTMVLIAGQRGCARASAQARAPARSRRTGSEYVSSLAR